MSNTRLSRRTILGGGLVLLSCGDTPASDDSPPARWPEDDMTTPAAPALTQPLILWGSVVANPNVESSVPVEQLANPFGLPMELLAVRFRILPEPNNEAFYSRVTGGGLKVKMDLGKAGVVTDFPIALFADQRDTFENQYPLFSGVSTATPTTYEWRLKYPLFIPAGKVLAPVFTPIGLNPLPIRIDVMYICRTWPANKPEPHRIKVPWAASFESKTFQYATDEAAKESLSSNLDIINPFDVKLELQRIGGRCSTLSLTAGVGVETNYIYEDPAEFRTVLSTLTMRSSRGFDLIRTPVPFEGAFPINWRSWDILDGWTMAPREYYSARVKIAALPYDIPAENIAQAQFAIGVVGYRDVMLADLKD